MLKKTILFDPFPSSGHISSFLRMAGYLRELGYRCVFVGQPEMLQPVSNRELETEFIHPMEITKEKVQLKQGGWFDFMLQTFLGKRMKVMEEEHSISCRKYDRVFEKVKPNLIILDDQYATKAFFYSRYSIPIIRLQTKVNPMKHEGIPPFQSHHVPSGGTWSNVKIAWAWKRIFIRRHLTKAFFHMATLGQTTTNFLENNYAESGFSLEEDRCFATGIKELPMVIATPRAFDFPRPKTSSIYHFFRASEPAATLTDPRLTAIVQRRNEGNAKIIYCSLGTVTSNYESVCTSFYHKLLKAVKLMKDVYFILSVGQQYDISRLADRPKNLSIFPSVPQKELLSHVDLMISHGGMNSIQECIHATAPMLILPLSLDWDQPGNGARVAFHGLGTVAKLRAVSVSDLLRAIVDILDKLPHYKNNIRLYRDSVAKQSEEDINEFRNLVHQLATGIY